MVMHALNMSLLALSVITSDRQHIHDTTAARDHWEEEYDFIVVGAGAAGCVVANRLAASNSTVLLLEAGGAQDAIYNDIPGLFTKIYEVRPDLHWWPVLEPQTFGGAEYLADRIYLLEGKTLGGSSTHNNMMFSRGNPKDYDLWEHKYGAKGWNFKAVLPFFKKFENNLNPDIMAINPEWHGTDGPVQITTPKEPGENLLQLKTHFNSLGFNDTDINGPNQTGTMIGQSFITAEGLRSSASNAYIDPNPYPKSLHIVTKALVTKILFNGLTAVGVEFAKNDKPFRVYARKEVIISAGAIHSPQLLMLSGVGPKEHLEKFNIPLILDLPVGDNFRIHPIFTRIFQYGPQLNDENLEQLYYQKSGPLSQSPFLPLFLSTESNVDKLWPNFFLWAVLDPFDTIFLLPFIGIVKSSGTVRLNSTSPTVQPLIDPKFYSDPQDLTAAIEAVGFLFNLSQNSDLAPYILYPTLASVSCPTCPGLNDSECIEGIKCFLRKTTLPANHPCGTCRMGDVNRDDVVVDPHLQVKNAKNLRVCDASIMPEIPNGNLYAPSLMIGEKCAQLIKDSYHLNNYSESKNHHAHTFVQIVTLVIALVLQLWYL